MSPSVALAMRQTSVHYPPTGSRPQGDEHPAYTPHGVRHTTSSRGQVLKEVDWQHTQWLTRGQQGFNTTSSEALHPRLQYRVSTGIILKRKGKLFCRHRVHARMIVNRNHTIKRKNSTNDFMIYWTPQIQQMANWKLTEWAGSSCTTSLTKPCYKNSAMVQVSFTYQHHREIGKKSCY